jgi:predicted permease
MVDAFFRDLRFAARQLVRNPGFACIAVLSLALGIGAAVAVFSVIYTVLLHPWPYKESSRIVQIYITDPSGREDVAELGPAEIDQLRQASIFTDIVTFEESYLNDTGGEYPDDVDVVAMTGNAFSFFGVPALLGRTFLPSDAPPGQAPQPVVVLTFQYWQKRFQGNRSVIGQTLSLDHKRYTILGVMPRGFTWMDPDVYVPLETSPGAVSYFSVMRLRPAITPAAATARVDALFKQFAREQPQDWPKHYTIQVRRIGEVYSRPLGSILYALFGVVALLLAIACGNVSILLLARGAGRQDEFAMRVALGASRVRIAGHLLTESLLLSVTGCILGTVLAWRGVGLIARWMPFQLFSRGITIPIHLPVLLFSLALALVSSICFGLLPALEMSRPQIAGTLQATTRRQAGSRRNRRLYTTLICGQIAPLSNSYTLSSVLTPAILPITPFQSTSMPTPNGLHARPTSSSSAPKWGRFRGLLPSAWVSLLHPSAYGTFPWRFRGRRFQKLSMRTSILSIRNISPCSVSRYCRDAFGRSRKPHTEQDWCW